MLNWYVGLYNNEIKLITKIVGIILQGWCPRWLASNSRTAWGQNSMVLALALASSWSGLGLEHSVLKSTVAMDCLCSGLWGLTIRMYERLLVLHYLFNTFLSNFIQPSNTSRRLKQVQWRTTATRGQQWKPTSRLTLYSHFWRECYQYRTLQLQLSAFSVRAVSSWNRIVRDLAKNCFAS